MWQGNLKTLWKIVKELQSENISKEGYIWEHQLGTFNGLYCSIWCMETVNGIKSTINIQINLLVQYTISILFTHNTQRNIQQQKYMQNNKTIWVWAIEARHTSWYAWSCFRSLCTFLIFQCLCQRSNSVVPRLSNQWPQWSHGLLCPTVIFSLLPRGIKIYTRLQ